MNHHLIALLLLLTAFALSAVFYRHRGRDYAAGKGVRIGGGESFRLVYRYLQLSTLVAGVGALTTSWPAWLRVHASPGLAYAGIIVGGAGLAGFLWAKHSLGAAYSPCFDSFLPQGMVCSGAYAYVRHPVYSANLLLLLGLFLACGSAWVGLNALLLAAYYVPAALREEAALGARFPAYRDYMSRTRRFIPFVM